ERREPRGLQRLARQGGARQRRVGVRPPRRERRPAGARGQAGDRLLPRPIRVLELSLRLDGRPRGDHGGGGELRRDEHHVRGGATAMSGLKEQLRSLRIERDGAAAAQPAVRRSRARSVIALAAVIALVGFAALRWITAPLGVHVVYSRAPSGDQPISGPVLSGSGYLI